MVETAKSIASLSWAASVFGARQFVSLFTDRGRAEGSYYSVTEAVTEQFGTQAAIFGAYQIGDEIQRGSVDLLWDVLELRALNPQWLTRTAGDAAARLADAARALTPGDNLNLTIDLLRNTFGVINLVNQASSMLNLPPGAVDLQSAIERAYSFGEYSPLWLVEGLGEAYADRTWSGERPPRGLLTSGQGAELPEKSLLMMHAGMGISLARRAIRPLTPVSPKADIAAALQRFIELVRANSRPGYEGPAFESLGLVTRTWYAQMVPVIDELLWTIDIPALEYFWHGVGRSLYFTPLYLVPGSNAFRGAAAEAPHELGLLNATAGAAWAFTLVNIQQPEVVLNLVRTSAQLLESNDAFTDGVVSTMLMASDMLPGDPYPQALCSYRPRCGCAGLTARWERLVARPCELALREIFPLLKKQGRVGEVFRYRNWKNFGGRREAGS